MKKSKRECTCKSSRKQTWNVQYFPTGKSRLESSKRSILQRSTDSCLAGCRWSYATKGHEGLSSLRSLGLVIRRQGGKKNSATINNHKSSSINIQTSLLMTSTGGISVTRWELEFFEIFPAVGLRMNRGGCFIHLGLISL